VNVKRRQPLLHLSDGRLRFQTVDGQPLMANPAETLTVVMLGATGAVGGDVVAALQTMPQLQRLSLLNRRALPKLEGPHTQQHVVDVFQPSSYSQHLAGHQVAICTFGVGEPTKVSHEELVRVDKDAVIAFATACSNAGIKHFELLCSVAADPKSRNFYLRTKGQLRDALVALGFERLSIFQPSMILTPTNRYGLSQALTLKIWPLLNPLLRGSAAKYRGINIETLGGAMAANLLAKTNGVEILHWPEFVTLAQARA
jgi:uncharacterized protein YbjT (DUF2867 family)